MSRMKNAGLLAIVGCAACASGQVMSWNLVQDGSWSVAGNWDPSSVPDTPGESAVLGFTEPYTVSMDIFAVIDELHVTNPAAVLNLNAGRRLTLGGPLATNEGLIQINPVNSGADVHLEIAGDVTLAGAGEIWMRTSAANSQVSGVGTLTNESNHTVRGVGYVRAATVNEGEVLADIAVALSGDSLYVFEGPFVNSGTMGAMAGSSLIVSDTTLTQAGGILLAGDGGGRVLFGPNATVIGGELNAEGDGEHGTGGSATLEGVTSNAPLLVNGGHVLTVLGAGLTNNGRIEVNPTNSGADVYVHFGADGTLGGTGEMWLRTSGANSRLTTSEGVTLTHAATHTVRGVGYLTAAMVNQGVVVADVSVARSGDTLWVFGGNKVNNSLFGAAPASVLDLSGITIDQRGGGELLAMDGGGQVRFDGGVVIRGGELNSVGDGLMATDGATTLEGVISNVPLHVLGGATLSVAGPGLTNNGIIEVNPGNSGSDAFLHFPLSAELSGSGEVWLRTNGANSRITAGPGETITNGSGHTVRGVGWISAGFINEGLMEADVAVARSGTQLFVFGDSKVNNSLMRAAPSSFLEITDTMVDQSGGGRLEADAGGEIRPGAGAVIRSGSFEGPGRLSTIGDCTLEDFTLNGDSAFNAGNQITVTGAGLTNHGAIVVNPSNSGADVIVSFPSDATLGGTGTLTLESVGANSRLNGANGVTVTHGAGHTIGGIGQVNIELRNEGRIAPGMPVGELDFNAPLDCLAGGAIEIEIASTSAFDTLDSSSSVTLGGTLEVRTDESYGPAFGDAFTIVDAASVAGEFDAIDAPGLAAPLIWAVQYRATQAILRVTCKADTNVDGVVNTQDVLAFLNAWTAGEPEGDFNGDGSINTLDVLAFLNAWTAGC